MLLQGRDGGAMVHGRVAKGRQGDAKETLRLADKEGAGMQSRDRSRPREEAIRAVR